MRRWFEQGLRSLLAVRREVDVLNVFPVADGDTGTNLVLTLAGAARAVGRLDPDATLTELTAAAARGALVGARGNSGVILGQAMHGLARAVAGRAELDGPGVVAALGAAADDARRAVHRPVEGTMLTVADAAARAARAVPEPTVEEVVRVATEAATSALLDTRSQLPVLAEREVVDAGAAGYVVLLEALAGVVSGVDRPAGARARAGLADLWSVPRPTASGPACALGDGVVGESGACAFEVMYVLRAPADDAARLRRHLDSAGESVAVVGGADADGASGLWQVHVHTDDPAAVLSEPAAMEQVCVRPLLVPTSGVVACTAVPGLAAPLAGAGAVVVLYPDRPGLERGVVDAGAAQVLVLAPDEATADLALSSLAGGGLLPGGPRARVVPTGSEVALLAVVAELGPAGPAGAGAGPAGPEGVAGPAGPEPPDVVRLVGQVRTAECAVADLPDVVAQLLRPDDEVCTAVVGDVPGGVEPVAELLRAAVRAAAPLAEVIVLSGGQTAPELMLGVQ